MPEAIRTSLWTAQHVGRSWYVTRRVWLSDAVSKWESIRTKAGRVRYLRSMQAAQKVADELNAEAK